MTPTIILAITLPAHAGKLADGFRGIPYGEQPAPAPLQDAACVTDPEPGVPWLCSTTIGTVPVKVGPTYDAGRVYGFFLHAKGASNCDVLMDTLTAAYGPSTPARDFMRGKLDDRIWYDGNARAAWDYNQFSHVCTVAMFDATEFEAVKAAQAAKAATATGDL